MGKKKPSAPPPDYGSLWGSYNKWQQEDAAWKEWQMSEQKKAGKAYQDDISREKAAMAAAGYKAGSKGYQDRLARIKNEARSTASIEQEYQQKVADSRNSLVYKDLQKGYSKFREKDMLDQQSKFIGNARQFVSQANSYAETGMAYGGEDRLNKQAQQFGFKDVKDYRNSMRKADQYEEYGHIFGKQSPDDMAKINKANALRSIQDTEWGGRYLTRQADTLGFKYSGPNSMEEWATQQFGSKKAANPYGNLMVEKGLTEGEKAELRAKAHASGRKSRGTTGNEFAQAMAAMEESPWL